MLEELVTVKLEEYLERYCGGLLIKANDNEKAEGESAEEIQNRKGLLENKIGQYTSAIENLYVDKASGVLDQDSFSDLLISMMDKKRELLYELKEADKRLGEMNDLAVKGSIIPDAVRFLISTIEVSKKDPLSHEQEVLINWLF
jgi:hypothetical protein